MPNIFGYTDYRQFLNDCYKERKAKMPSFSYNNLSLKAGFKSKSYIYAVMHGSKNLTKPTIIKLAQALGLKRDEAAYFENMAFFNQAKDAKERSYFYEQLQAVKPHSQENRKVQELRKDQYEYYSKWYHNVVRSLVDMFPVNDDYKALAKKVHPAITPQQAKKSVTLLKKLGFIIKQPNGAYRLSNKSISTGKEVASAALLQFHLEAMQLAAKALQELPSDKRNVSGLTLGISEQTYKNICDEIYRFQEKIMAMADKDDSADRVYRLNFHFFPVSQEEKKL